MANKRMRKLNQDQEPTQMKKQIPIHIPPPSPISDENENEKLNKSKNKSTKQRILNNEELTRFAIRTSKFLNIFDSSVVKLNNSISLLDKKLSDTSSVTFKNLNRLDDLSSQIDKLKYIISTSAMDNKLISNEVKSKLSERLDLCVNDILRELH
jgi:hypothetical protein